MDAASAPVAIDTRPTPRQRAFEILEHGRRRDMASRMVDRALVALILANVVGTILSTVPEVAARYGGLLTLFDRLCVAVFAAEYAARIWAAPEHPLLRHHGPALSRLSFAATPLMLIDALALVPFLLEQAWPAAPLLVLTRLVRFLKLARYSPALATIGRVIAAEWRALLACIVILMGVMIAAAAVMLAVEGRVQPSQLGDMPKAMWWSASMLAKIGGGEIAPSTAVGRVVAAVTVMLGIFCFALPVAILGRGFYEEIRRRDFVVTFAMVARVPLFSGLKAATIADLVGMLRARTVPAGTTIVRKGERGEAMFFIASGAVDVQSGPASVRLGEGDVFGEMALLTRAPRNATVTAAATTDLLVLDTDDFARLVERLPHVRAAVETVALGRSGADEASPPAAPAPAPLAARAPSAPPG